MPTTSPIRILLIDDHELMRAGMRMLLEQQRGMLVAGEAADSAAALELAAREQPDIILLDLDLGGESGVELLPRLLAVAGQTRVIMVTGVGTDAEYQRAVRLGAMGLVRKAQAVDVLVRAIERVHAGEVWLDPMLVAQLIAGISAQRGAQAPPADPEAAKIARLTPREREVIELVGAGLYNNQIAERLSISEVTVSHHLTSIFSKLGLANRFDLVVYAYRHGLARPAPPTAA